MDSASCSFLRAQPFSSAAAIFQPSNNTTARFFALPKNNRNPNLVPLFSSTFPRNPNSPGKCLHFDRFSAFSSLCGAQDQKPSQELAVLLEVDGVFMDAYQMGNRQSFNAAFKKLGHLCTNWTEPVYLDLLRKSGGDEEKMVNLYFNRIGWPSSLPTTEKESFVKNALQKKKIAMDEFLMSESLTLRPGVEEFIDDAYKEGVAVVVLTTYSKSGNQIASLTARAEFPWANAIMDGFGGADLTISKLRNKRRS